MSGCESLSTDDTSLRALLYAVRVGRMRATDMARVLYSFNQAPLSLDQVTANRSSREMLGIGLPSEFRIAGWEEVPSNSQGPWISWHGGGRRPAPLKLYVCVSLADLRRPFRDILAALRTAGAAAAKVAASHNGLVRPDRFVSYFENRDALLRAAVDVAHIAQGLVIQSLPFGAMLHDECVRWGIDFEETEERPAMSWRLWLTNKLGAHLQAALDVGANGELAVQKALQDIALAGIDPTTWTPTKLF